MLSVLFKKGIMLVRLYTDDFLFAYSGTQLFQGFLSGINNYFPVDYKEYPELSYMNLRIIQSPCGISIYQAAEIKDIILSQWFPDVTERFNSSPTPFKAGSTFEITLVETLPYTPAGTHHL